MCERLEEELLLTSQSSKFGHVRTQLLLRPVLAFDSVVLERHVSRHEDEAQELSAPLKFEVVHRVARHRALDLTYCQVRLLCARNSSISEREIRVFLNEKSLTTVRNLRSPFHYD